MKIIREQESELLNIDEIETGELFIDATEDIDEGIVYMKTNDYSYPVVDLSDGTLFNKNDLDRGKRVYQIKQGTLTLD